MVRTWHLAFCGILFFLSVSLGSVDLDQDTVYVAYQTNLVNLTYTGNHTFRYRIPVGQTVEERFFKQVDGLDCDKSKRIVCWTDQEYHVVRCSNPSADTICTDETIHFRVNNIVIKRSGQPKDVAIDPCHRMLYWTDPVRSVIGVARIDRTDVDRIIALASAEILTAEDGLVKPNSIAVDSCNGYVFFTDVGVGAKKVARANTDGSSMLTLTTTTPSGRPLRYPTAIALDRPKKVIFFGDSTLGEIYKMTYDGNSLDTVSEATAIYDMALGCSYERIMYTSLSALQPKYELVNGSGSYSITLKLIGPQVYHGACSYCDHCSCETDCSVNNGGCSHLCFEKLNDNTRSSECGCPDGYILDPNNKTNCIVDTCQLLVSDTSNIISIKQQSSGVMGGTPTELSLAYLSGLYGLDYVEQDDRQYVVVADRNSLKRLNFDGSGSVTIVNSLDGVRGVAADCVTGNIYYCQMSKGVISVTNLKGTAQFDCHRNLLKPFEIVLNTKKGTLFFTSIGSKSIYTASMDCDGNPTETKARSLAVPAGLALDGDRQILYWTDFAYGRVRYYDITKGKSYELARSDGLCLKRPVELTLLGDNLYFTDWGSECVGSVSTQSGTIDCVYCKRGSRMHGITHTCKPKQCHSPTNGDNCRDCSESQMCILSPENGGSTKCHCPPGFVDRHGSCQLPNDDFILVSARHAIVALSLSGVEDWIAQLPLPPQENILSVEFDYDKKTVFWSDVNTHTIMSAHLDGTNIKVLLIHNPHRDVCRLCSPEGLAYDKVEERLYYTDSAGGEICYIDVASGTQHPVPHPVRFLGSLDSPRAIVIKNRKLYFSEIGNTSTISSVDIAMPTPPPDVVVSDNLTWPNALAISRNGDRLYFGDASEDYIAYYNFQSQKVVRLSSATHVYDMVEYAPSGAPQLLWSDWGDGVVKMLVNTRGVVSLASSNDVHYASGIKVFTEQQ